MCLGKPPWISPVSALLPSGSLLHSTALAVWGHCGPTYVCDTERRLGLSNGVDRETRERFCQSKLQAEVIPDKCSWAKFERCPYLLSVLLVSLVVSQRFVFLVLSQIMSLGEIFLCQTGLRKVGEGV